MRWVGALVLLVCLSGALQPTHASCASSSTITTTGPAGQSFIVNTAFQNFPIIAGVTYAGTGPYGPYVYSFDPLFPVPTPLSPAATISFWALGSGDPAIGIGDDNGAYDLIAGGGFSYTGSLPTSTFGGYLQAGTIATNWNDPNVEGCLFNAGATAAFDGDECTAVLLSDQDGSVGEFALVTAQVGASGSTSLSQPGSDGFGNSSPIILKPLPAPTVTDPELDGEIDGIIIQANDDLVVELTLPAPTEGLYEDPACGSAASGFRIFHYTVPRGSMPPTDATIVSGGWLLPDLASGFPQGVTPLGTAVRVHIPCGASNTDVYLGAQLVFDSGFATSVIGPRPSNPADVGGAPCVARMECGPNVFVNCVYCADRDGDGITGCEGDPNDGDPNIGECTPFAYVANGGTPSGVGIIDTATNGFVGLIPTGSGAQSLVLHEASERMYVARETEDLVDVVDTSIPTVITSVAVGDRPTGIAVTPNGARVYMANIGSGDVTVIDTASNTVIATVPTGPFSNDVEITPDGSRVYVAVEAPDILQVIDTTSNTIVSTVPVRGNPHRIVFSSDGLRAYVTAGGGVQLLDTTTNLEVDFFPVLATTFDIVLTPDETRAYVSSRLDSAVYAVDLVTKTVVTIPIPFQPSDLAVTSDGQSVYVTRPALNQVTVIDTSSNTIGVSVFSGGTVPRGISIPKVSIGCPVCGDGTLDPGEECDDGNMTHGDGCSAVCMLEPGECTPVPGGLVGWWPGDGSASDVQSLNDGTLQGGASFVPGFVGLAFDFDGIDDDVTIGTGAAFGSPRVTVETWVRPSQQAVQEGGFDHIVTKRSCCDDATTFQWSLQTVTNPYRYFFGVKVGNVVHGVVDTASATADFAHVAGSYDGETVRLYVNGVLKAENTDPSGDMDDLPDVPVVIGSRSDGAFPFSGRVDPLQGQIDEAAIYDRALNSGEIQAIFDAGTAGKCKPVCGDGTLDPGEQCDDGNAADGDGCSAVCILEPGECTPVPGGLVGWWPGDGSASDVQSLNDGTLQGGASFVPGFVGLAFDFDGIDDDVTIGTGAAFGSPRVTVETWVRPSQQAVQEGGFDHIVTKRSCCDDATTFQWSLQTVTNPYRYFFGVKVGNVVHGVVDTASATADFAHVAGSYDGETVRLYVNGVLKAENTDPSGDMDDLPDVPVVIGSRSDGAFPFSGRVDPLQGQIDEAAIYDRALNSGEIQAIFDAGAAGKCKPVCGDGILDPGEQCDDGNITEGDGCSAVCTIPVTVIGPPAAFVAVQNLISGSADGATSVATGDFDRDGDLDVISTSREDDTILWYRNSGTSPPFFTPFVVNEGGVLGPHSVFVSDIDGDGDPDVLTASRFDNTIAWWENDLASGTLENWTKQLVYNQHQNALQAVAGDLDGDGDMDIVSVSNQLDMIVWHENDSGVFTHHVIIQDPDLDPQNAINGPMNSPFDVSLSDLDNDGDLDIVAVATFSSTVEWFQNDVAASGPLAWTIHNLDGGSANDPFGVAGVATGDVDGDGDPDVVTAAPRQDKVSFWVNPGSPANENPWPEQVVTEDPDALESGEEGFANSVVRVVLADLDADGDMDILSANAGQPAIGTAGGAAIASYENVLGDGTVWVARTLSADVDLPLWVHAADLDSDGDVDALSASFGDDSVAWYQNRTIHRSAIFPVATPIASDSGVDASTFSVALGDVDGDGDLDLVAGNGLSLDSRNRLFLNNGTDDPWNGVLPFDFPLSDPTAAVALGDVDGDGDLDLVVGNLASANQLYLNNGTTDPWNAVSPLPLTGDQDDTTALALGDVDNDGDLDLVAGNEGQANRVYLNDGDGDPWDLLASGDVITADADGTVSVALGDVDGDGDLDLVAGNNLGASGQVNRLYLNNGTSDPWSGVVGSDITLDANVTSSVALGDVDNDGDLDLIEGNGASQQGRLYLNDGTADPWGSASGSPISCGEVVTSQALGDVDIDGDLDALAADSAVAQQIYLNNGSSSPFTGAVCKPIAGSAGFGGQAAALGDVDGDGDLDVVVGSGDTNEPITWYANLGGQYRFGAEDVAPTVIYDEGETAVLAVEVVLNARAGDSVGELARLELLFESAVGFPLNDAEANALIDTLSIYRDTGSGEFESGSDVLVQTFDPLVLDALGVMNVVLQDDEPNLRVAAPATFFAVATITPDASSQVPATFRMTFLTDPRSIVEDASTDSPLRSEPSSDLSSSLVTVMGLTTVNSVVDGIDPGPLTTFREAIVDANANAGDDRIVLEAETYTLGVGGADEDGALTGDLDVTDTTGKLTIVGKGAGLTIIDGGGLDRVFHVLGGDLEIRGVTIRGGMAGTVTSLFGGAIANEAGNVTITDSVISGNMALGGGGAIYNSGGSVDIDTCTLSGNDVTAAAGRGGAILNTDSGYLSIDGSTISGNTADNGGALSNEVDGVAQLTLTTISGNDAVDGGAVFLGDGTIQLTSCSVIDNTAAMSGGGLHFAAVPAPDAELQLGNTIVALNSAPLGSDGYDATGGSIVSTGYNLIGDATGLNLTAGAGDLLGTTVARVEPLVGPLQNNGGPTETHALRAGSPATDAGNCTEETDQRGTPRVDVPGRANRGGNGCDIGAYEIPLADLLPKIDIPIRWCVVEGAPSFDFLSSTAQEDVNAVLRERHVLTSNSIFEPQAAIRFRSAANIQIPNYPILPDPDLSVGDPGDVVIEPEARNYDEFQKLIAACRDEWEALDPSIVGITAVQINKFVDPNGVDFGLLGMGGRAEFGDPVQQMVGGRVMVVDDLNRMDANPPDTEGRLLGHELAHASSLPHGDGVDNPGPFEQCENGKLDDDDDLCEEKARFDGDNLMQYRNGIALTIAQILQMRLHTEVTVPDLSTDPETSGLADLLALDDERSRLLDFERSRLLDFERSRLLDFERSRLLDFERSRLLDFERSRLLDFEEAEILDFGFLDVIDYGMTFGATNTTVYASLAGLIWPTPIRPATVYFWYLDVDESDLTGATPVDFGFPGGLAQEEGVDVIVQVNIFSECDIDNICEDFVIQQVFDWDDVNLDGYDLVDGPIDGFDSVEGITVGLVQSTVGPERDDPTIGMIVRAIFPNSILENAVPGSGFILGDPIRMEVIAAIACELTLPDGTLFDCQCTDCLDCPDYPGCDTGIVPDAFKECTISTDSCITDVDCLGGAGDLCSGENVLIIGDEPGGQLQFVQPVFPSCAVDPAVAEPGDTVTVAAIDFPTTTGRPMTVLSGADEIGVNNSPAFDSEGITEISATIPAAAIFGEHELTVLLEGFATAADCVVILATPAEGLLALFDRLLGDLDPNEDPGADKVNQARDDVLAALDDLQTDDPGDPIGALYNFLKSTVGNLLAVLENPGAVDPEGIEQLIEAVLDFARLIAEGFLDEAIASCGPCDPADDTQPDQVCEAQEAFDTADEIRDPASVGFDLEQSANLYGAAVDKALQASAQCP